MLDLRRVAQLVRAPPRHGGDRWFESTRAYQIIKASQRDAFFIAETNRIDNASNYFA